MYKKVTINAAEYALLHYTVKKTLWQKLRNIWHYLQMGFGNIRRSCVATWSHPDEEEPATAAANHVTHTLTPIPNYSAREVESEDPLTVFMTTKWWWMVVCRHLRQDASQKAPPVVTVTMRRRSTFPVIDGAQAFCAHVTTGGRWSETGRGTCFDRWCGRAHKRQRTLWYCFISVENITKLQIKVFCVAILYTVKTKLNSVQFRLQ